VAKQPQVIGMVNRKSLIPVDRIEKAILLIRGQKIMLDADLAALYGVETKVLVQAVKRNLERFPEDFMFQLSHAEFAILRSQIVASKKYDAQFKQVFEAIRQLMAPPEPKRRPIGFRKGDE
jgi:hypothetical protein